MKLEIETEIAAPPHVVYATVTDIARWPEFIRAVERLEMLTAEPIGVGTKFRETRTMFGRTATEEMTVAALNPPGRFDLTAENHGTRYLAHHEIVATPGGSNLRRIDTVPVRAFPAREQIVDRRRSGPPARAIVSKRLAIVPALGMRLQFKQADDVGGGQHCL